jgi:hypothetical protein
MRIPAALLVALLAGCASDGRNLEPGVHDAKAVRAAMGAPKEILKAPEGGEIWFYPRGRVGRETLRAELGPDGKLRHVEQVLHEKSFDRIVAGKTTREELRRLLGPPDHEWLAMNGAETNWEYRYWWAQLPWVMTVGIDQQGFVTSQFRGGEYTEGGM